MERWAPVVVVGGWKDVISVLTAKSGNISTPAEYLANTNQVGGDFCQQPATFDNPACLIFCETLN